MSDQQNLERRVAALEQEIADLRRQLAAQGNGNWLERIRGSMKDQEGFLEAMAYGRAIREADRPNCDADESS